MRQKGIGEVMLAPVGLRAWIGGGAQQGERQGITLSRISIRLLAEQCHPMGLLTQVHPLVGRYLELHLIPTRVGMGAALTHPEGDVIRCAHSPDIDVEGCTKHQVVFPPIDMQVEINALGVGAEGDALPVGRLEPRPCTFERDPNLRTREYAVAHLAVQGILHQSTLLADIPGIKLLGQVHR